MSKKTITVAITNGKSVVSVDGVQGKSCTEHTAELEAALGKTVERTFTADHAKTAAKESTKQKQKHSF